MDLTNNPGDTSKENAFGNNEAKNEKRAIFGLQDESLEGKYKNPENEMPGHSKDFLEKLHIRNHELNTLETIHELYRDEITEIENGTDLLLEEDEYLFNEVCKAVTEKDIFDLRANLQAISKTISGCQLNSEDIEKYLDGDLDTTAYELIQDELKSDINLADEIDLYSEINEAIAEKDIMQLRLDLRAVILTESSHSLSHVEIEDYLCGELDESLKNSFEDEIINNQNLSSEIMLFNEIDEAIREKDVMNLRSSLKTISKDLDGNEVRGLRNIIPYRLNKKFWYAVAASIVVLIGSDVILHIHSNNIPKIYSEFYQPAEFSPIITRSATNPEDLVFNEALTMLSIKEYDKALKLFSDILNKDNKNSAVNFYVGTIYQMKELYAYAIESYKTVIEDGNNLFTEQSNWYLGLCYIKMDQRDKAIDQFKKISEGNAYYCNQSISILKKLE